MIRTQEYHKKMREYFQIENPGDYLDQLWIYKREVRIDIIKFDEWLHEQLGEYDAVDVSMSDALTRSYGEDACSFIRNLL